MQHWRLLKLCISQLTWLFVEYYWYILTTISVVRSPQREPPYDNTRAYPFAAQGACEAPQISLLPYCLLPLWARLVDLGKSRIALSIYKIYIVSLSN